MADADLTVWHWRADQSKPFSRTALCGAQDVVMGDRHADVACEECLSRMPAEERPSAGVDWRSMFSRYADWVAECEGVDFLYPPGHERSGGVSPWTPEEWAAIEALAHG